MQNPHTVHVRENGWQNKNVSAMLARLRVFYYKTIDIAN